MIKISPFFLTEATTRQSLRSMTSEIAKDIMRVLRGEPVESAEIDFDAWDSFQDTSEIVISQQLGPYQWLPKIADKSFESNDDLDNIFFIPVSINVTIDSSESEINVAGLSGATSPDGSTELGIDVYIRLPASYDLLSGKEIQLVNNEVKNTIAHELEHLTQEHDLKAHNRGKEYYEGIPKANKGSDTFLYLVSPEEVSAHVMGYAAYTKSWNELVQEIKDFLRGYQISGQLTTDESSKVLEIWLGWADKNLKQRRFER